MKKQEIQNSCEVVSADDDLLNIFNIKFIFAVFPVDVGCVLFECGDMLFEVAQMCRKKPVFIFQAGGYD